MESAGVGPFDWEIRRGHSLPETSRLHKTAEQGPPVDDEFLYRVVDALDEVATTDSARACEGVASTRWARYAR
jgi:hypothetical protein